MASGRLPALALFGPAAVLAAIAFTGLGVTALDEAAWRAPWARPRAKAAILPSSRAGTTAITAP